jgi:transposase
VSGALAAPVETAREFVRDQAVNNVDETGWREQSKLHWLWVNATEQVTAFQIAPKRDAATAREVIGRAKKSIITTDRYLGYSWLATQRRQVCWAHLKRDFQALAERGGESQEIGEALLVQTKEVFRLWHQVTDGTLSQRKFQRLIAPVQQRVKELLDAGSDCRSSKTRGTCRQIRAVEVALWAFGFMAAQVLRHPKPGGESFRRAHPDGHHQLAPARTRCHGISHCCMRFGTWRERLNLPAAGLFLIENN